MRTGDLVLGIESSCDDSAVAVYEIGYGVRAHAVRGQQARHRMYGGVVPELASRDHAAHLLELVCDTLGKRKPSAVACTTGPGLAGCLIAGAGLAQALAYGWQIPLARVNHLEGHLLSPFLAAPADFGFPYLALLASGGHTQLYDVAGHQDYRLLGTTLDDAVGEAFDKTAMLLGLPFPGGAQLERLARQGNSTNTNIKPAMRRRGGLDFSFSGLKTAARRLHQAGHPRADIAAAFQQAAIGTLINRVEKALRLHHRRYLAVVGGVGRNAVLRASLRKTTSRHGTKLCHPPLRWCADNAAMIAYAGQWRLGAGYDVTVKPRWPLATVTFTF